MLPVEDMTLQELADAMGDARAQIKLLRAYEADLRHAILERRLNGAVNGAMFELRVRRSTVRRIDKAQLPASILQDDRFWVTNDTMTVVTKPHQRSA